MMDLNTMLNGNFIAVDQPKEVTSETTHSKSPTNNRMLWDNSTYSLPINIASTRPRSIQQPSIIKAVESQSLDFLQHISSDGRSNVSSLTSTTNSPTRSRVSSLSVPENLHLISTNLPIGPLDSSSPRMIATSLSQEAEQIQPPFESNYLSRSFSPFNSSIASDTSKDILRRSPDCLRGSNWSLMTPTSGKDMFYVESPEKKQRPSSPSDAVLIKRPSNLSLRPTTEEPEARYLNSDLPEINRQSKATENRLHSISPFVFHKRALSAPIFNLPSRQVSAATPHIISTDEITPPNSVHPDHTSPKMMSIYPTPDTPPISSEVDAQAIKCMYIPDCDTGSQLRKAISHIFGRNKICTRQIPSRVWVHYCRKHYQRSRYRNPKEYAKLQCDLVQQQIRRVHEWSQVNANLGRAGVVQDWSISVRKREQKRLDDLQNGRKRKAVSLDREFENDEDESSEACFKSSNSAVPATAVPDWLLEHCRKGYSTHEILAIFNRLHQEILDDLISTFPDIEILPNITIDQEDSWLSNGYTKRHQTTHHKRAKSLSVNMNSIYESGDCRLNNSSYLCSSDTSSLNFSPIRRISTSSSGSIATDNSYQTVCLPRVPDLSRRNSLLALHPRIEENQVSEDYENFYLHSNPPSNSSFPSQRVAKQNISPIDPHGSNHHSFPQPFHHQNRSQSLVGLLLCNHMY